MECLLPMGPTPSSLSLFFIILVLCVFFSLHHRHVISYSLFRSPSTISRVEMVLKLIIYHCNGLFP